MSTEFLSMLLLQIINGLVWGMVIALIAIGLSMIYGLIGIVNMAHGSFYMLGAFIVWFVSKDSLSLFWLALPICFLLLFVFGLGIERFILRRAEDDHVLTIIVTLGLMYIIERVMFIIFGGGLYNISEPVPLIINIFGRGFSGYRLFVGIISLVIILFLWLFLERTKLGLWIRAVKQNPEMATALGIPAKRMKNLTFAIGAGLAGIGGAFAAPIVTIRYEMGASILIEVFLVTIVGGLGKFQGTLLVALMYGFIRGALTAFIPPTPAEAIALSSMILILLAKPEGLIK